MMTTNSNVNNRVEVRKEIAKRIYHQLRKTGEATIEKQYTDPRNGDVFIVSCEDQGNTLKITIEDKTRIDTVGFIIPKANLK